MADPAEIAAVALFLASDDSSFMTASESLSTAASRRSEISPDAHREDANNPAPSKAVNQYQNKSEKIMSYAIIGFGKIGQALAHAFARKTST
jgi:phosphoglycerate dehydrogenase-like enzyme